MSTLAESGPPDTNTQIELQTAPEPPAAIIAFPRDEIAQQPQEEKSQRLSQTLESLIFQDTNIITTELKELGVFIEDLEGEREGLGIWIVSERFGNRLSQHLWVDYSSDEDQITGVLLQDELHRISDEEMLARHDLQWVPDLQPADEIIRTAELLSARVAEARVSRDKKIKNSAKTYGRLVMERAISTLD